MTEFKIIEDRLNFSFTNRRIPEVEAIVNSYLNDGWTVINTHTTENYIVDNCLRIIITLQRTINEEA